MIYNDSMRIFITLVLAIFSITLFNSNVEAKVLPQAQKTKTIVGKAVSGSGINVTPKLRSDKRALIIYFSNLQNAKSVSYSLIYSTNDQQEGAMGGLNLTGTSTTSQELLFGTCSKNVCTYHQGIHEMKLEVSYTSKSGKKYLKKYKIKI